MSYAGFFEYVFFKIRCLSPDLDSASQYQLLLKNDGWNLGLQEMEQLKFTLSVIFQVIETFLRAPALKPESVIVTWSNPSHTLSVESTWQQTNQYINLEISIQGNKHMKWVGKRDNLIGYQELVYFKISLMVWILLLLQWEKGLGLESWEVLGYICMSAFVSMYLTIIIK